MASNDDLFFAHEVLLQKTDKCCQLEDMQVRVWFTTEVTDHLGIWISLKQMEEKCGAERIFGIGTSELGDYGG